MEEDSEEGVFAGHLRTLIGHPFARNTTARHAPAEDGVWRVRRGVASRAE